MKLDRMRKRSTDPISLDHIGTNAACLRLWNAEVPKTIGVGVLPIWLRTIHAPVFYGEHGGFQDIKTLWRPKESVIYYRTTQSPRHCVWIFKKGVESTALKVVSTHDVQRSDSTEILSALEQIGKETNEPDFAHRPTDRALSIASDVVRWAYTHFIGCAPQPNVAPDGLGGLTIEWKREKLVVRLVVAGTPEGKTYIYSRGTSKSELDYNVDALALSQRLSLIFSR